MPCERAQAQVHFICTRKPKSRNERQNDGSSGNPTTYNTHTHANTTTERDFEYNPATDYVVHI